MKRVVGDEVAMVEDSPLWPIDPYSSYINCL